MECFTGMMKQGLVACPTCGLSMQDMSRVWASIDMEVASTPMPTEYAGLYREILCRDCNKTCTAAFHIVGMKCSSCGSYNTTLDKGPLLRWEPVCRCVENYVFCARLESKEGEEQVFVPLTEAEIAALSNVSFPIPDNVSDIASEGSDNEDGWETTEEVVEDDEDAGNEMVEEDLDWDYENNFISFGYREIIQYVFSSEINAMLKPPL
jgi:hypothetical protein